MNKYLTFRMTMAERGVEMTPAEAKEIFKLARGFMRHAEEVSMEELMELCEQELEGISEEDKQNIIMLYKSAKGLQ